MVNASKFRWQMLFWCSAAALALGACSDSGDNGGGGGNTCDPEVEDCEDACTAPEVLIDGECCIDSDGDGECDAPGGDTEDDCVDDEVLINGYCCVDANDNGICDDDEADDCDSGESFIDGACCVDANDNGICDDDEADDCDSGESFIDGECCVDLDNDGVCDEDVAQVDRLMELHELSAGADCAQDGQILVSGLDLDEDGSLSEEEIDTQNRICIPNVRAELEILEVGDSDCEFGGYEITFGGDDGSGGIELDGTERSATVCRDAEDACVGSSGLEFQYFNIEKDDFMQPFRIDKDYAFELMFSRNIDSDSAVIVQSPDGFVPDAEAEDVLTVTDERQVIGYMRRDTQTTFEALALVGDACGAAIVPALTGAMAVDTAARVEIDGPIGVFEPGDEYEVCWWSEATGDVTLRLEAVMGSDLSNYQLVKDDLDSSGCHTLTLDEAQAQNNRVMRIRVQVYDDQDNAVNFASLNRPQEYSVYGMHFGAPANEFLPSWGGYELLDLIGHRLEKCVVSAGDGPSVTVTDLSQAVPVRVDENAFVDITCEADDGSTVTGFSQNPITVGNGIFTASFGAYGDTDGTSINWSTNIVTYNVDGSCEGEIVVDDTVTIPFDGADLTAGGGLQWSAHASDTVDDAVEDVADVDFENISATVTCTDSAGDEYTVTR